MILYRSVGLQELALIYDSGMKAFPARLPQQPIFYPVLDLEYARQTASGWNAQNGQFAGYVTQFKVEDEYIQKFEKHTVGESQHEEFWIPAEEVEEFNQHINGQIKVVDAHFGGGFQGFIPEQFGLQGKNAVEQFTVLSNSYIYKRMEFFLEIKRNHKAVFLNYPFWQKYDSKNPGLKEKILQAIKEAWFTSFPKNPLMSPIQDDTRAEKQLDSEAAVNPVVEDRAPVQQRNSPAQVQPVKQPITPPKKTPFSSFIRPVQPASVPVEPRKPQRIVKSAPEDITPVNQRESHFVQGIKLGLSGKYHDAIDELSKTIREAPDQVVAHTSLGVAYHRLGEDDRALDCYQTALKIDPNYAEAHYFRANILYGRGDVREAIAAYTRAIGLDPDLIEAHQNPMPQDRLTDYTSSLAEMYWISKPAHRILDLTKSLDSNPRQANLFKERAAAYFRLRNYEQTIADYNASLQIEPGDASVLHFRGLAYEQIGQQDRALEDYEGAIDLNPQLSDVYINRGVTLGKMGNFRQSLTSLSEAIRLAPQNPDAYFNRAMTYFQLGDLESAITDFSRVIKLSPRDDAAYYWRGISHEEAGRQGEATADYRQFLTLSQDPGAREEVEQRLSQWNEGKQDSASNQAVTPVERQKTNQLEAQKPDRELDLYGLIDALGDRALNSLWFGIGVECYGEKADKLYAWIDQNKPIPGRELLDLSAGIRQTVEGDFTAFDPDATSHWLFIRAWGGTGFYIETNDPKNKKHLMTHFQSVEEVEGAYPPYEGLFIHI